MGGHAAALGSVISVSPTGQVLGSHFLLASSQPLLVKTEAGRLYRDEALDCAKAIISFKLPVDTMKFPSTGAIRNWSSWINSSTLMDIQVALDNEHLEPDTLPDSGDFQVRVMVVPYSPTKAKLMVFIYPRPLVHLETTAAELGLEVTSFFSPALFVHQVDVALGPVENAGDGVALGLLPFLFCPGQPPTAFPSTADLDQELTGLMRAVVLSPYPTNNDAREALRSKAWSYQELAPPGLWRKCRSHTPENTGNILGGTMSRGVRVRPKYDGGAIPECIMSLLAEGVHPRYKDKYVSYVSAGKATRTWTQYQRVVALITRARDQDLSISLPMSHAMIANLSMFFLEDCHLSPQTCQVYMGKVSVSLSPTAPTMNLSS